MISLLRADVIYLIKENPGNHGWFDDTTYTERMVYCTVRSVGMTEYYRAHAQGLEPSVVFDLADMADYDDERILRWGAKYYRVVRTYVDGLSIELTCEEIAPVATTEEATTSGSANT